MKSLYVVNNNNAGTGSLRAALKETQKDGATGTFNIIFGSTDDNDNVAFNWNI